MIFSLSFALSLILHCNSSSALTLIRPLDRREREEMVSRAGQAVGNSHMCFRMLWKDCRVIHRFVCCMWLRPAGNVLWCNAFSTVFKQGSWMTLEGGVLGCFFFWNDILGHSCLKTHRFWVHNPRSINKMHHCCRRECKGYYILWQTYWKRHLGRTFFSSQLAWRRG